MPFSCISPFHCVCPVFAHVPMIKHLHPCYQPLFCLFDKYIRGRHAAATEAARKAQTYMLHTQSHSQSHMHAYLSNGAACLGDL